MKNLRSLATDLLAEIFSILKGRPVPQPKAVPNNRSQNRLTPYPKSGNT